MIKRRSGINLYEYVEIGYQRVEDMWKPVNSYAGLDKLKANKDIPAICILLSKIPLLKLNGGEN
jgi:hypothetical protein